MVWDAAFTPFGEEVAIIGAGVNHWRFPGQYADEETGLSYNWMRTYDPSLGRYLQSDPIGLEGGLNTYAYVGGNPLSHVDPTGEIWKPLVEAAKRLGRSQAAKGAAAGAGSGGAIEAGAQLIGNGGRLGCLDWSQIGQVALLGAAIGSAEAMTFEGLAALMNRVRVAMNARVKSAVAAKAARQGAQAERAVAQNVANAAKLSRQQGSQEGVAELLGGGGKAIAGAGTKIPLRNAGRLVNQYGGKTSDWAKVTTTTPGHLQTHAYRNVVTGEVVELKSILP